MEHIVQQSSVPTKFNFHLNLQANFQPGIMIFFLVAMDKNQDVLIHNGVTGK